MHLRDEEAFLAIMREKYDLEIDEVEFVEDDTDVTSEEVIYKCIMFRLLTIIINARVFA
jgi:hypothetical protein